MRRSEAIYRVGFERLGDAPFSSIVDMARIAGDLVRLGGHRSVYGLVSKYIPRRAAADRLQLPSAADRRQPVPRQRDLLPDPLPGEALGRSFRHGRHGRARRRSRQAYRVARRRTCGTAQEVEFDRRRGRRRDRRQARFRERRSAASIVVSNADSAWTYRHLVPAAARKRWTDRKLDRARYSMGLFVWYFGTDRRLRERRAPYDPARSPLPRAAARHFRLEAPRARFQPLSASPDRNGPDSLAPKGCDAFYVLSPVPNLLGGQDWRVEAEPYRRAIARALEASILPGLIATPIVTSHDRNPARLPEPAQFVPRRRILRSNPL